jgi:signal recognition particle receptor subunit beta
VLPLSVEAYSDIYRSDSDPARKTRKKFSIVDTPGHGKLRHFALEQLTKPQQFKGIIYVVDAADLDADSQSLRDTAEYLHDILLLLQKSASKSSRSQKKLTFLIAANKTDLFTALPASLTKKTLETEISKFRDSRAKGLLDSGTGELDPEKDWLGETGEGGFEFDQMEEILDISVEGGSVQGAEKPDISKYWAWIGNNL